MGVYPALTVGAALTVDAVVAGGAHVCVAPPFMSGTSGLFMVVDGEWSDPATAPPSITPREAMPTAPRVTIAPAPTSPITRTFVTCIRQLSRIEDSAASSFPLRAQRHDGCYCS
ncbi:hypothetical protein FZI85_11805 [Mycobacterium sp. CBMA293]|nr:hypothetical protein [Mycolicibacterium sp. CBMA 293]